MRGGALKRTGDGGRRLVPSKGVRGGDARWGSSFFAAACLLHGHRFVSGGASNLGILFSPFSIKHDPAPNTTLPLGVLTRASPPFSVPSTPTRHFTFPTHHPNIGGALYPSVVYSPFSFSGFRIYLPARGVWRMILVIGQRTRLRRLSVKVWGGRLYAGAFACAFSVVSSQANCGRVRMICDVLDICERRRGVLGRSLSPQR